MVLKGLLIGHEWDTSQIYAAACATGMPPNTSVNPPRGGGCGGALVPNVSYIQRVLLFQQPLNTEDVELRPVRVSTWSRMMNDTNATPRLPGLCSRHSARSSIAVDTRTRGGGGGVGGRSMLFSGGLSAYFDPGSGWFSGRAALLEGTRQPLIQTGNARVWTPAGRPLRKRTLHGYSSNR